MKHTLRFAAVTAALLLANGDAYSQTATGDMGVSMTVAAECTLSVTSLDFGSTGIIDAAVESTAAMTVQCTEGTPYTVGLSAGTGTGATVQTRLMTHATLPTETVAYSLFRDAGRTLVWGATTGTDTAGGTATGADETLTVYGRVFSGQNVPPGAYSDTVTATISY